MRLYKKGDLVIGISGANYIIEVSQEYITDTSIIAMELVSHVNSFPLNTPCLVRITGINLVKGSRINKINSLLTSTIK